MAIYYLDRSNISGTASNANTGLDPVLPKLTWANVYAAMSTNDILRESKTAAHTAVAGSFVWTYKGTTITAPTGHGFVAGSLIGKPTAAGNGAAEGFYSVLSVATNLITLTGMYAGTTETTTALKVNPFVVADVDVVNITATKHINMSGGWTLGASPVQNGETWISPTTSTIVPVTSVSATEVSNYNVCGFTGNAFSGPFSPVNCSATGKTNTNTACGFNACVIISGLQNATTSGFGIAAGSIGGGTQTVNGSSGSYGIGTTINGGTQTVTASTGAGFGGTCLINAGTQVSVGNTNSGFFGNVSSLIINGGDQTAIGNTNGGFNICYIYGGTQAATTNSSGFTACLINGGVQTAISNTTGFSGCSGYLKNTVTNSNAVYGIGSSAVQDLLIENWSSTVDAVGLLMSDARSSVKLVNCSFTTPVNWAISRSLGSSATYATGCAIDAPSLSKAYQVVSGASYAMPQYYLTDSFGQTGLVYANASVMQNKATTPYSLQIIYAGTSGLQFAPFKVGSAWVRSNTKYTVSINYSAPTGSWTGTIVPTLRLDGKVLLTGTTITSITATPATITFSPTALEITNDGELSVEVTCNSNNVAVNWGSFSCVKG